MSVSSSMGTRLTCHDRSQAAEKKEAKEDRQPTAGLGGGCELSVTECGRPSNQKNASALQRIVPALDADGNYAVSFSN
ncbi:hypothetical protein MPL3356_390164 [Mesorhizobium plurifarium]|uniref:Uncharacterized protein n=1 Tax=Mesorhizobium plurifarium TaxID=69974 RepID=A0A090DYG8_MESPL|nr:hypothetical protein MPL3356_390164 [Mesorhizobium plurifarium]